ncbi:MAG: hypothetical protein SX243_04135 [Acidobacteriota bacterium]|nr:hypothetical protein [Acidobacteriota bacterium]
MMQAVELAQWACGGFFMVALLTGVWKYAHIRRSAEARAPVYVDIAHRAAFLYSFSCLLLAYFADLSRWPSSWNTIGVAAAVLFFATAQSTYLIHGLLRDTDNQLARPYTLGRWTMPSWLVHGYMLLLIGGEIGGFLVVFTGAMIAPH